MSDRIISFTDSNKSMAFAIEQAQETLNVFFDAFLSPQDNQESFLLKVKFEDADNVEHIWVADIDSSTFPLQGTVANETNFPNIKFMQRVEFHPSRITDWMFIEDGFLVGGYTTQVIRSQLTPQERVEYDANAPYKFKN